MDLKPDGSGHVGARPQFEMTTHFHELVLRDCHNVGHVEDLKIIALAGDPGDHQGPVEAEDDQVVQRQAQLPGLRYRGTEPLRLCFHRRFDKMKKRRKRFLINENQITLVNGQPV